jgi:hypothetical protein
MAREMIHYGGGMATGDRRWKWVVWGVRLFSKGKGEGFMQNRKKKEETKGD